MKKYLFFLTLMTVCCFSMAAVANIITVNTPTGATTSGGPVDASATFITGTNTLRITLTNLQANITDVAQALSDLQFALTSGQTTGTLINSFGQEITIASNGTFTLGGTVSTGWGLNNNVSGGLQLDALGFVGPKHLIVGPPGGGGTYSNANGSIAGNNAHNPFLNQSTFTITVPGVNVDTSVINVIFSFGTTAGIDVPGVPPQVPVPEPGSMMLLGTGLFGLAGVIRRKLAR